MKLEYVPMLGVQRDLYRIDPGLRAFPPVPPDDARSRDRGSPPAPDGDEPDGRGPRAEVHRPPAGDGRGAGRDAGRRGCRGQARRGARRVPRGPRSWRTTPGEAGPTGRRSSSCTCRPSSRSRSAAGSRRSSGRARPTGRPRSGKRSSSASTAPPTSPAAGAPRTLRDILLQEGSAMRLAGARNPALDRTSSCERARSFRACSTAEDQPTLIAALFGDRAAQELGHPPLGLPPRAGLALALHGRLESRRRPSRDEPRPSKPADVVGDLVASWLRRSGRRTRPAGRRRSRSSGSGEALSRCRTSWCPARAGSFPIAVVVLLVPTLLAHAAGRHRLDQILGYGISVVVTLALVASLGRWSSCRRRRSSRRASCCARPRCCGSRTSWCSRSGTGAGRGRAARPRPPRWAQRRRVLLSPDDAGRAEGDREPGRGRRTSSTTCSWRSARRRPSRRPTRPSSRAGRRS